MERSSAFSYACNQCGRCCRDQVITLSPYDVMRIARAGGVTTGKAIRKYTIRRGSLLKFSRDGTCVALVGVRCTLHQGRPLACRLYPLGLQRREDGAESYIRLEPAVGSLGEYGVEDTVAAFLAGQETQEYLASIDQYQRLLPLMHQRIEELVDFDSVEPGEFRRVAVREALAEQNFDPNRLIDAMFNSDQIRSQRCAATIDVTAHVAALNIMIREESDPGILAAAAVLLAVSLGYPPRFAGLAS